MSAEKKALRALMAKRRAIAHANVDPKAAVDALILALQATQGPISFYWPIRTEIDPRAAMVALSETRTVCLPVTHGHGPLTFRAWRKGQTMETDGFGVATPDKTAPTVVPQTLVVPMLAFDLRCHRLGYGAGHYDRTLEILKAAGPVSTLGLAYSAQAVDDRIPIEPTDQALDAIITEKMTIRP